MQAEIIDSIKFTTLSPDTIKKMSVAKLIVADTYNEDGYPIDGGLMDQRLGVIDPGLKCKTCGGRAKSCMGHFGHIELVRPVIHPEFARFIYMLLQSTCEKCNRVMLSKELADDVRSALKEINLNADEQKEELLFNDIVKKLKTLKKCPYCGSDQHKRKFERPTFFYLNGETLKPDTIRDWLANIPDEDLVSIGIDPNATRPEWLILSVLLVPPVNVRPSITLESGERSEDDLTHKLVEIMRINERLSQDIDAGAPQIIIDDLWELLQYHVTTYFNNETPGVPVARHRSTKPLKTLAQRLKGKEGRLRYNLSGKRVNFSARSVISSDASLTINQVGVPMKIASVMTIPLYVTKWNIEAAKKFILNPDYPKALNVISKGGIRKRVTETNREDLVASLEPGDVVERQLMDNDLVLFNRQPTLHRLSIMAHRVKVMPGKTFRIQVSAAYPYNADYDGDEMNLHVPQTLEAQAEAMYMMQPKNLMLSARHGQPVFYAEEDEIAGAYFLTKGDTYYTKDEAALMLAYIGIFDLPDESEKGLYNGKDIISMLFPKDFNFTGNNMKGQVIIKNGKLIEGILDARMIGEKGSTLISKLFIDYGPDFIERFILNLTKISLRAIYKRGLTVSVKDYIVSNEMISERDRIIKEVEDKANKITEEYNDRTLESLPGYTRKQTMTTLLFAQLSEARDIAGKYLNRTMNTTNNAFLLASIGARGSIMNVIQMSMLLGQQSVRGKRPSRGYSGRVLPYFRKNDKDPRAKGFVTSCFFEGLTPTDFFEHAMGARDSAATKSLVTAVSGYMYRRLVNAMMDFYISEDKSVRGSGMELIQPLYGGDGIDPMYVNVEPSK
ncbi:DNA-directed RNA polymerase subunit A' [Candidatus Mancarchaeum acidiphilum]|uniref:DNA-directed RNA polymerase subunit Rpo1N n=1 Tax=Candidatus Mancarchaeum acidiphilum TaxID=1920749 RepID=A0A218NM91_9ARCH|nr:DNA-directed RNA polymerase subunit A' [Candidatus Mancarchaeum acidiphilum]ASI13573.1 DNA-directed RNA polymerase subunit A' [Candidatus Mancarchaeum acidiphilum]